MKKTLFSIIGAGIFLVGCESGIKEIRFNEGDMAKINYNKSLNDKPKRRDKINKSYDEKTKEKSYEYKVNNNTLFDKEYFDKLYRASYADLIGNKR